MGAEPRLALLSLALPAGTRRAPTSTRIVTALAALAGRHRLHVVGGNLTRSPGPADDRRHGRRDRQARQVLTRGGARPGDEIYVTGTLGAAAAGLRDAEEAGQPGDAARQTGPRGRARATCIRSRACGSALLLGAKPRGDGMHGSERRPGRRRPPDRRGERRRHGRSTPTPADRARRARAGSTRSGTDPVAAALTGGDDYELLFTVRPAPARPAAAATQHGKAPLTRIGVCTERSRGRAAARRPESSRRCHGGFTHFR